MTPKELMIKNDYFVSVYKHKKAKNVILARYPKNIFSDTKADEEIYQYYIENDQILITNLNTKQTKNVPATLLEQRVIILCDIAGRALKRGISLELIVAQNKKNKILHLMPIPQKYRKAEREKFQMFASVLKDEKPKSNDEFYQRIKKIYFDGGII